MKILTDKMNLQSANNQQNHFEVRHHNIITTARYDYSACQIDIMFYMLSLLRPYDTHETIYKLQVRDIENITGRKWNYQQLKEATENMGSKMFEVDNDKSYKQIWMFQHVEYMKGMGCVEIRLTESIRPYFFDLKSNFTSFELYSALKVSSKYAKRIYAICSQWKDIGQTGFYDLDELKMMLKLKDPTGKEPEQFKQFSQFKEKVLDISVKQINESTDLKIRYELAKDGRSFKKLRFFIDIQKTSQLAIPFELSEDDIRGQTIVSNLASIGIIKTDIVNQILNRKEEFFKWWYEYKTGRKNIKTSPSGLLLIEMGIVQSKKK
ncbi:MAG: replication initiation protein [Arcicella sp.]|jgi:plasmid replication initiation protein|nr:replication initiation protein [Arcicella sp.]